MQMVFFILILKYNYEFRSSRILKIKDILCEKEPMPQNNEVYSSSYVKHHLTTLMKWNKVKLFCIPPLLVPQLQPPMPKLAPNCVPLAVYHTPLEMNRPGAVQCMYQIQLVQCLSENDRAQQHVQDCHDRVFLLEKGIYHYNFRQTVGYSKCSM